MDPRRILGTFEPPELEQPRPKRGAQLTFAIVGARPTGVELSGQLRVLCHRILRDEYRSIDPSQARIVLLDAVDEVLPSHHPALQRRAHRDLDDLGVDVRPGHSVVGVDETGLDVDGPDGRSRIEAGTIVWSAGVRAPALADELARTASPGGR